MSALPSPELGKTSLENRAPVYTLLLKDPLLSCGSARETAYIVQCTALYCFAE